MDDDLRSMIAEYRQLSTANVSDGLDRVGLEAAPRGIGPLWDSCGKIVGPAFSYDEIVPAIANVLETFVSLRDEDERFLDCYRRVGIAPFKERLYENH